MKPKIYIETSVVSYYTSRPNRDIVTAARQQVTREWRDEERHHYEYPVISSPEELEGE